MSDKFIKRGNIIRESTYDPSADGLLQLIDDFYGAQIESFGKAAGSVGYGLGSPNGEGYFNALQGKQITVGIFSSDNIFSSLGARAYDHEGVRIQYEQAAYGMADEFTHNGASMIGTQTGFLGIGAGTNQDGYIPDSVYVPIDDFREPYKEVPFSYDYGLGMQALENKDDTIAYKSYVEKISRNYSDLIDKTILRPLHIAQPTAANNNVVTRTAETSLQGIARAIASGNEIGKTYRGVSITPSMVSPYGGTSGDFYTYRGADYAESGAHVENNLDGNVVDLENSTLSIKAMRELWRNCSVNWANSASPNGKMWALSNIAQDKLGALMQANQMLINTVYAQRDFHGVRTIPGRDAGLLLNSFNNIPIIQDGNLNFDFTTKKVSRASMGDVFLLDLDHIWMSMLTPVQTFNINNPAITRALQERNVMNMRAELRTDGYIFSGRITNIADDA